MGGRKGKVIDGEEGEFEVRRGGEEPGMGEGVTQEKEMGRISKSTNVLPSFGFVSLCEKEGGAGGGDV